MDNKPLNQLTDQELWKLFPILLSEYKPYWQDRYGTEKEFLLPMIGSDHIYRINHIGSTAVPGLVAKPTIDILLEMYPHTDLQGLLKKMETGGYIYSPQPGKPPPHMMFMKGYTPRGFQGQAYHVHIRYPGDWDELYFRDYLIAYPETAQDYGELKRKLKAEFTHNRDGYTLAKTDFIQHVTQLARIKFPGRYN